MTSYSRGDVILVDIAFSGAAGSKRRPAVVVSSDLFNRAGIKLVVAAITSNTSPPFRPGDILLRNWQKAGLIKPSAVRGVLATVDRSDVVRTLGLLSTDDLTLVEQGIARILGFNSRLAVLHEPEPVYDVESSNRD
jgi:mRNA interferase MazF